MIPKKFKPLGLLLVLLAFLLGGISIAEVFDGNGDCSYKTNGACVAYILDRSGSMTGEPLENEKAATNQGG